MAANWWDTAEGLEIHILFWWLGGNWRSDLRKRKAAKLMNGGYSKIWLDSYSIPTILRGCFVKMHMFLRLRVTRFNNVCTKLEVLSIQNSNSVSFAFECFTIVFCTLVPFRFVPRCEAKF